MLYTDAIGTGVAFSTHAKQAMGSGVTTDLFPLTLEGQRIVFLRLFVTSKYLFGGIDAELNLDTGKDIRVDADNKPLPNSTYGPQLGTMVQIGGAL